MKAKREKILPKSYAKAIDLAYNDSAGAIKGIPVWPEITSFGVALSSVQTYDTGKTLLLFNNDTSVHYYAMAPLNGTAPTAPSGPTSGIPVPAGAMILISLGDNGQIISDSGNLYAYTIDDDSYISAANPQQILPPQYWDETTTSD